MSIFPISSSITGKLTKMRVQLEVRGGVENFKTTNVTPFFTVIKPRGVMFPFKRDVDLVPKNKKEDLIPTYLSYDQLSLIRDLDRYVKDHDMRGSFFPKYIMDHRWVFI